MLSRLSSSRVAVTSTTDAIAPDQSISIQLVSLAHGSGRSLSPGAAPSSSLSPSKSRPNDWDMIDDNAQVDVYAETAEGSAAAAAPGARRPRAALLPTLLSGFTNGAILFVFCCVFSSMIFGQNAALQNEVALGVGFFTVSTFVGGIVFGRNSKFPGTAIAWHIARRSQLCAWESVTGHAWESIAVDAGRGRA